MFVLNVIELKCNRVVLHCGIGNVTLNGETENSFHHCIWEMNATFDIDYYSSINANVTLVYFY